MSYAVMPMADYKSICDKVREKTETSELIKSGEMADRIEKVYHSGQLSLLSSSEALQGSVSGEMVVVTDVSSIEHNVSVQLSSEEITDFSSVKLRVSGKNLFNPSVLLQTPNGTATGWGYENGYYYGTGNELRKFYHKSGASYECPLIENFAENTQYTLSFTAHISSDTAEATLGFFFSYTDGSANTVSYVNTDRNDVVVTLTSKAGKTISGLFATVGKSTRTYVKDIQCEASATATEYEPYIKHDYTSNADGSVEGVKSIYPVMNLSSDTQAVISAEYYKDIDKVLENLVTDIALSGGE